MAKITIKNTSNVNSSQVTIFSKTGTGWQEDLQFLEALDPDEKVSIEITDSLVIRTRSS